MIQEAPSAFTGEEGNTHRHHRKEEAGCQVVEKNDTQVAGPAEFPGKTQDSARGHDFPANHQQKDTEKEAEACQDFVIHADRFDSHRARACLSLRIIQWKHFW